MSNQEFVFQFEDHKAYLQGFALSLTKDREEANDLFQETSYKAFKYRHLFKPGSNMRAWLTTIMKNTFINHYWRYKRKPVLNDTTVNDYLIDSTDQIVPNGGEGNVTIKEISKEIEKLEDLIRIPFLLQYNGYKYEEIASQLDVPLGTVKSRIHQARKKLRLRLTHLYQSMTIAEIAA
jgi:RNA polymerase sigma-70 factor (ECF subfamily)